MKIEHIKLTNFRNYDELELDFNPNINIIVGNNGQGKTNILESIYVLSLSKSNRDGYDSDMIKFEKESLSLEGKIIDNDLIKKLRVDITPNKKRVFINNKEIHKIKDYISNFCVISFVPTDLDIIKGSPSVRRNLLNIDISQLYNNYITYLNEYNKIIKIRNDYLKKLYINLEIIADGRNRRYTANPSTSGIIIIAIQNNAFFIQVRLGPVSPIIM